MMPVAGHGHHRPSVAVIADDLAGAADTAAQFASPDRPALVLLEPTLAQAPREAATATATCLAIDADCRHCSAEECDQRIKQAVAAVVAREPRHWFLKLDSTLRGNVGAALKAAIRAVGAEAAILAPAFPERERTVRDGVLLVGGVPVGETEIATDDVAPVTASGISAIIRRQWRCSSFNLRPADFLDAPTLSMAMIGALGGPGRGARVLILDAASAEDMRLIVAAAEMTRRRILLAGSAGLARGLAELHRLRPRRGQPTPRRSEDQPRPVLAVIGSRTARASAQVEALRAAGIECLASDDDGILDRAAAALSRDRAAAVIPAGAASLDLLARIAAELHERVGRTAAIVLSGGATARRFCELSGVGHFTIEGELQPGVAVGRISFNAAERPLVIKGGAAGGASAIVQAIAWLSPHYSYR